MKFLSKIKGPKAWAKFIISCIVILFAILGLSACIGFIIDRGLPGQTSTIKLGFSDISELATQSCVVKEIEPIDEPRKVLQIPVPFTTKRVIFASTFNVKAGYDYDKIKITRDDFNKDIYVVLPKPHVLSTETVGKDEIFLYEDNIFNDNTVDEHNTTKEEMKERAKNEAINNGLYDNAYAHARGVLEEAIKKIDEKYCNYNFIFKQEGDK